MGYETRYELERVVPADAQDAFLDNLVAVSGYSLEYVQGAAMCKWYEHADHITEAMLKTGVTEVDLHGEGEEQGDVWDKEFRLINGEMKVRTFSYKLVRPNEPDAED